MATRDPPESGGEAEVPGDQHVQSSIPVPYSDEEWDKIMADAKIVEAARSSPYVYHSPPCSSTSDLAGLATGGGASSHEDAKTKEEMERLRAQIAAQAGAFEVALGNVLGCGFGKCLGLWWVVTGGQSAVGGWLGVTCVVGADAALRP